MSVNDTILYARDLAKATAGREKIRVCLGCGRKFKSWGPGNRKCAGCKSKLRTQSESGLMGFR